MLLALAFLASTTLLGWMVCARWEALRGIAEKAGMAMVIGLLLQLWLPFFTSKVFGIKGGSWLALGICGLGAAIWLSNRRSGMPWPCSREHFRSRRFRLNLAVLLILGFFFGWLFYTHSLRPTADGLTSAGVAWEDQSYHAMLASSFLYSENLAALQYPHFTGWPLGYPFLADLLAATLAALGATLGQAFWWSAWYAGLAFLLMAWTLVRLWLGSDRRAWLALVIFFCAGGLGFVDCWREWRNGLPWPEWLMRHDYTNGWELTLHYHNPLTGILLPMRTSLFGMPIALAILLLLARLSRQAVPGRRDLVIVGTMTGLLPLIHAHSFLAVGIAGVFYGALLFPLRQWGRIFLWSVLPMLVIAGPQLFWTHAQMAISEPFLRWHLGWKCDATNLQGWLAYWLHNGGLLIPLGFGCWFFAVAETKRLTAPLLALLVIGNLILFQPNDYDNIKLFAFTDLALAALVTIPLAALARQSWWTKWLAAPLFLVLTTSGLLSIARELRLTSTIVDWGGVAFAQLVREKTAPRAVFLTSSQLTHPVPVLTGRPLVLGYTGWLGQHGVPIGERQNEVRTIFEGGGNAVELLHKYDVSYVVVGPPERLEFPALNEAFLAQQSKVKWTLGEYALFELRQ